MILLDEVVTNNKIIKDQFDRNIVGEVFEIVKTPINPLQVVKIRKAPETIKDKMNSTNSTDTIRNSILSIVELNRGNTGTEILVVGEQTKIMEILNSSDKKKVLHG